MTVTILFFQIALPLALLGWILLLPSGSATGLLLQTAGV
jgi:hypothetical protein